MSDTQLRERPATRQPPVRDWLARAWFAVVLIPVFFFVAFAIAEGLYSVTGHDPSTESPPVWADAVAVVPAAIVFLIPCTAAAFFGRRAVRAGHPWGVLTMLISVVASSAFVVMCFM